MVHRWASHALALGIVACVAVAPCARGQSAPGQRAREGHRRGVLRQNEPNPFSHQTTIPFSIGSDDCAPGTQQHVVTLRIYNILSQIVAVAVLADSGSAGDSTMAGTPAASRPISNLSLPCGSYIAQWDGMRQPNGREAPSGVYMYQLMIDGRSVGMKKMVLAR